MNECQCFLTWLQKLLAEDPAVCPVDPAPAGAFLVWAHGMASAFEVEKLRAMGEQETVRNALRDGFARGLAVGVGLNVAESATNG
jgi:hypothetical protein